MTEVTKGYQKLKSFFEWILIYSFHFQIMQIFYILLNTLSQGEKNVQELKTR